MVSASAHESHTIFVYPDLLNKAMTLVTAKNGQRFGS